MLWLLGTRHLNCMQPEKTSKFVPPSKPIRSSTQLKYITGASACHLGVELASNKYVYAVML